jgi:hypothetical protein
MKANLTYVKRLVPAPHRRLMAPQSRFGRELWLVFGLLFASPGQTWAETESTSVPQTALPEPEATEAAPSQPASPSPAVLMLETNGFDQDETEALRSGLEAELKRPVVLADFDQVDVSDTDRVRIVRTGTQSLEVQVSGRSREPLLRTVAEPAKVQERLDLLVLLGASMVRDVEALSQAEGSSPPAVAPAPLPPPIQPEKAEKVAPEPIGPWVPAHFSIFHPLATNAKEPLIRTAFSASLIQGRVGRVEGLALGGFQSARYGVEGIQLSYLGNFSRARVVGAQLTWGVNFNDCMEGIAVGAVNVSFGEEASFGVQAGFANASMSPLGGGQLGFLGNYASDIFGLQAGTALNVARDVEGAQLTFGVNVSRDFAGVQLGALNVARNVRGVQLGLVNVAEDIEGVPIGLVSVTKSGGVHPSAWYSLASSANAGIRFAARNTYSVLFGSWDVEAERVGPGYELGVSIPVVPSHIFLEASLSQTLTFPSKSTSLEATRSLSELRGSLRFQVLPHLAFFGGLGYVGKIEQAFVEGDGILANQWYYQGQANVTAGIIL